MDAMKLSENFSLAEFERSQTAARMGLDNCAPEWAVDNLKRLCQTILQPLRDQIGIIYLSSGYRGEQLNQCIGGSPTSQHRYGQAADIHAAGITPHDLCQAIIRLELPFDQLILEFGEWVHVSVTAANDRPRGNILTASKQGGRTVYTAGLLP